MSIPSLQVRGTIVNVRFTGEADLCGLRQQKGVIFDKIETDKRIGRNFGGDAAGDGM